MRPLLLVLALLGTLWLPGLWGLGVLAAGVLLRRGIGVRLDLRTSLLLWAALGVVAGGALWQLWMQPPDALRVWRYEGGWAEIWNDLEGAAERAADAVAAPQERSRRQLFEALDAARTRTPRGTTFLLFDPTGEIVAWAGEGLLYEVGADGPVAAGPGFRLGFTAASLYVTRNLDGGTESWRLLAGRSFSTERLPPAVSPSEERRHWALELPASGTAAPQAVQVAAPGRPTLLIEPSSRQDTWAPPRLVRAVAALLLSLAVAGVALTGAGGHGRLGRAGRLAAVAVAGGALAAALGGGLWQATCAAVATATLTAALGGARPHDGGSPRWPLAVGLVVVVTVMTGLAFGRPLVDPVPAWTAARVIPVLAAAAGLFAALVVAHRRRPRGPEGGAAWSWILAAIGLVAIGSTPWPLVAGAAAAVSVGIAIVTPAARRGRVSTTALVGWALGCVTLMAAVAVALEPLGVTRRPPDAGATGPEAARDEVEEFFATLRPDELHLGPVTSLQRRDLALFLWQHSPLAERASLSAVSVFAGRDLVSNFSYGLPIAASGRPDPSPVRWADLGLPSLPMNLRSGSGFVRLGDRRLRLEWWDLPRRGGVARAHGTEELAAGLLRGALGAASDVSAVDREPDPQRLAATAATGRTEAPRRFWRELRPGLEEVGSVALTAATSALLLGVLLLLAMSPRRRLRAWLSGWLGSYSRRLITVFALLVLLSLAPLNGILVGVVSQRAERRQLERGVASLESAQRVLGEYVLSLDPGFSLGTALDDTLLVWLSRVIHHQVTLYWRGAVYAASRPELFTAGLLPSRIPGEIYSQLVLEGETLAARSNRVGDTSYLEIYAPLRIPGRPAQEQIIVSLPLLAQQEEVAEELATLRRQLLLVTALLFLALLLVGTKLARSFTEPLEQLVAGTRRIAEGAAGVGVRPADRELALLAKAIDEMAERVAEAHGRLVREKQLVERVVENVTAGVVSLDSADRVLMRNRTAAELLGVEVGEDLPASLSRRPELAPLAELLRLEDGPLRHTTLEFPATADDRREWTAVRVSLAGRGEPSTLLVVEDVTEVLRGQRLAAWAEMARIIAHEIKNPLTPIRLSAEHMREVHAAQTEDFDDIFERCTENILRQVEELRQIAGEFSTFSHLPRLQRQPTDLVQTVQEVVAAYASEVSSGPTVRFEAELASCPAEVDRKLLGRAVRNLLENAVRAAGAGGWVAVSLTREGREAVIRVADSGVGVAPQQLSRIFDPYFSTHEGGTGLGLPIARRIAEEHGGTVRARVGEEGGLEVEVRVPAEPVR